MQKRLKKLEAKGAPKAVIMAISAVRIARRAWMRGIITMAEFDAILLENTQIIGIWAGDCPETH